jgi:epidermal growth factor receptor substrate 15
LADTKGRGSLDLTDFTIGMYLIQACMSGQLPFVPTSLPPGLYEQAGGVATHATGGSGSFSPGLGGAFPGRPVAAQHTGTTAMASPLQQQFTGQPRMAPPVPQRTPAALGGSAFGMQAHNTGMAQQWDVTAAEKANSDRFFDTLDAQKIGFIDGDQAVPFMVQSGLPEDALSQIWFVHIYPRTASASCSS